MGGSFAQIGRGDPSWRGARSRGRFSPGACRPHSLVRYIRAGRLVSFTLHPLCVLLFSLLLFLAFFVSSAPALLRPTPSFPLCCPPLVLYTHNTLLAGPACRMPSVNPPYPSITLVTSISTGYSADTSRLPAYRASHSGRYHPYSRAHPSHYENHMVRACDSISPRVLLRHWTLIRVCVQSADNCRLSVPRPADFPAPAALKLRSGELKFCFPPSLSLCGYFIE